MSFEKHVLHIPKILVIFSEGLLPESVFARYVIPKIVELFHSRVLHVRLVLIEKFPKYVHLFESSVLKDIVLPEVLELPLAMILYDSNVHCMNGNILNHT